MAKFSLAQWCMQQLTKSYDTEITEEQKESYKVNCFILFHVKNGVNSGEEISTVTIGNKKWEGKDLEKRFFDMAETHASGLQGRQQYYVKVVFNDPTIIEPDYTFGKAGETQDIGIGTEGPSPQGLLGQMMRHNETVMRIMTVHTEALAERQNDMIETQAGLIKSLRDENVQAFAAIKEMVINQVKSEHDEQAKLLEYERRTKMLQSLMAVAPGILNKLTGGKLLPESSIAETVVQQLKQTLSPEQLLKITEILTPEQLAPLMQLLQSGEPQQ